MFWTVGGTDADAYGKAKEDDRLGELPASHNPRFAAVHHATLRTGTATPAVAAHAWLGVPPNERRAAGEMGSPVTST